MAFRTFRRCSAFTKNLFGSFPRTNHGDAADKFLPIGPSVEIKRNTATFLNRRQLPELWKSATSVSNPGRKRGRGKNTMKKVNILAMRKDLPIGFPGYNVPIQKDKRLVYIMRPSLATDNEEAKKPLHDPNIVKSALLRGWSGRSLKGKELGPPKSVIDEDVSNFRSKIVKLRPRVTMHSILGRVRKSYMILVMGNGNGTAAFACHTDKVLLDGIEKAKLKCLKHLMTIDRFENRTVMHDFFTQFGKSKIMVKQMPAGYGLVCHRALKVCCEAFGIKDIYAKCEGSKNIKYILTAFFIGLLKQRTPQQIAEDKGLHLVQLNADNYYYPRVLASPTVLRKEDEVSPDENLDFNQYILDGKIILFRKKLEPFYTKLKSYEGHLKKKERERGQKEVRLKLKAEYGRTQSFLTEKYPEAILPGWRKVRVADEEESAS